MAKKKKNKSAGGVMPGMTRPQVAVGKTSMGAVPTAPSLTMGKKKAQKGKKVPPRMSRPKQKM
jgi:hypothetical protein